MEYPKNKLAKLRSTECFILFLTVGCFLCNPLSLTPAAAVVNTTYYLSTTPPFGNGSSASAPLDASTQPKLDAIWALHMWQGSDNPSTSVTFVYAPGLYQTKGGNADTGPNTICSGNYHIGAGIDKTIIQLVGSSSPTADGVVFLTAAPHEVIGWGCRDLTIDCNAVNQPKWTGAGGSIGAISSTAGYNITIQRVKTINFGTATPRNECFPVLIYPKPGQSNISMHNIVIDSCIFTQPAAGNKDGCSASGISDDAANHNIADTTCVISNCQYINCYSSTSGQPGDFSYQHCYGAPRCINNFSINCDVGFYLEPAELQFPSITTLVQGNTYINVNRMAYILFHNSSGINNITIQNNMCALNSGGNGVWITGNGLANPIATVNDVLIQENTLLANNSGERGIVIDEYGSNDMRVQSVIINNNYLYNFPDNPQNTITLDPSTSVIVKSSVTDNYIRTGIIF